MPRGYPVTLRQRRVRSQTMKRLWQDPNFTRKRRRAVFKEWRKRWKDPRWKRKMSLAAIRTGKIQMAAKWKDPIFAKKVLSALRSSRRISRPQRSLLHRICGAGISGFRLEYLVGRYSLDIANPQRKIDIEVDGKYWHKQRRGHDARRDKELKRLGWKVLRVAARKTAKFDLEELR